MRAGKVISIIAGVLLLLIGIALFAPEGFLLAVHGTQRDASGFFETSSRVVSTSGYALTTPDVDVSMP